jgi:hypothetical protein
MARAKISKALKAQLISRANECCEFCRAQLEYSPNNFHIEHHIPLSRGGADSVENLTFACPQCNLHKAAKTEAIDPLTQETVPLFNPRQMNWSDHFRWSDDTSQMLGETAIGRATIALLQTNRTGMVNLRRVLHRQGFHPPD